YSYCRQPAVAATNSKSLARLACAIAVASTFFALAFLIALAARRAPELKPVRFQIERPAGTSDLTWPRLSPDGRWVAFQASDSTGVRSIWVRGMDALEARRLSGTEHAGRPFWAPSSREIGFFA